MAKENQILKSQVSPRNNRLLQHLNSSIEKRTHMLETKCANYEFRLRSLNESETMIKKLEEKNRRRKALMQEQGKDIAILRGKSTFVKGKLANQVEENKTLKEKVEGLEEKVRTLEGNNETLENQVSLEQGKLENFRLIVDTYKKQVVNLQYTKLELEVTIARQEQALSLQKANANATNNSEAR